MKKRCFPLLVAAESFCLTSPVGLLFLSKRALLFFKRLLCTTVLPVVLLTKHILQELPSKRLSIVELGYFTMLFSLQVFYEQRFNSVAG